MRRVVDTNVAVVANGRNTNVSLACRSAAGEFLNRLIAQGRVILDLAGEIQTEYERHRDPKRSLGVGDRFFMMILNSAPRRVERIQLSKDHATGEYQDFPSDPLLSTFHRKDRKFAALARKCGVPVANAVDPGWLDHFAALKANGILVDFVCGADRANWLTDVGEKGGARGNQPDRKRRSGRRRKKAS